MFGEEGLGGDFFGLALGEDDRDVDEGKDVSFVVLFVALFTKVTVDTTQALVPGVFDRMDTTAITLDSSVRNWLSFFWFTVFLGLDLGFGVKALERSPGI